jgi:hypothetical protein
LNEVEWRLHKKQSAMLLSIVLVIVIAVSFAVASADDAMLISATDSGVVGKSRGSTFTVSITFENTGSDDGTWTVNAVFEASSWSWKGTAKTLTLNDGERKTLVWTGTVPSNAALNSVARLVIYYDDSYKALDWWIRVTSNAELGIKTSTVT